MAISAKLIRCSVPSCPTIATSYSLVTRDKYFSVSIATLLFYDYLLTLEDEVSCAARDFAAVNWALLSFADPNLGAICLGRTKNVE